MAEKFNPLDVNVNISSFGQLPRILDGQSLQPLFSIFYFPYFRKYYPQSGLDTICSFVISDTFFNTLWTFLEIGHPCDDANNGKMSFHVYTFQRDDHFRPKIRFTLLLLLHTRKGVQLNSKQFSLKDDNGKVVILFHLFRTKVESPFTFLHARKKFKCYSLPS